MAHSTSVRDLPPSSSRRIFIGDPDKSNSSSSSSNFAGNTIRTGKYTVLSFIPRNLFEQFHRVAYVYFLAIAVLNQLPMLAVFGRGASILPLAFVLTVTLLKDGYEDWRRHRSDRSENDRPSLSLSPDAAGGAASFRSKPWKEIRVGEILKISADETVPSDLVLLSTSDPSGVAYIQTVNLDGESNLKTRYAKLPDPNNVYSGVINCELPNRNIYGFVGNVEIDDGRKSSLGPSNIVLRGCEVKNTEWIVGVVVYAGNDTKVMLNNSGASSKRSRLETHMNRETISLSVVLFVMCLVVCVLHGVWLGYHRKELDTAPYFRKRRFEGEGMGERFDYYGVGWEVVFTFFRSVIVFQIMIPISLYISMELVRVGQAYFMIRDRGLFDEESNSRFQCRALNINEDLGQVRYVFSDKTGTLTENKMDFQCASIGGVDYNNGGAASSDGLIIVGSHVEVDGQVWRPKMTVRPAPELLKLLREGKTTERWKQAHDFFMALAACNTIVPLVVETSDPTVRLIDYQGESPDEQALVYAAAAYGFVLIERTSGHVIIDVLGRRQRPSYTSHWHEGIESS